MKTLKEQFENIANDYVKAFCKKHEIEFDFWIANRIGENASFNCEYSFHLDNIRYDIDNKIKKHLILRWQEDSIDAHFEREKLKLKEKINFENYTKMK